MYLNSMLSTVHLRSICVNCTLKHLVVVPILILLLLCSTVTYATLLTLNDTVRVLVKIDNSKFKEEHVAGLKGRILVKYELIPYILVELPQVTLKHLKNVPGVLNVELDGDVHITGVNLFKKTIKPTWTKNTTTTSYTMGY